MIGKIPLSRYYLPDGVFESNGELFFDHEVEYSQDWRKYAVQMRSAGIQKSTVWSIIHFKYPEISIKQFEYWLTDFITVWAFRKTGDTLKRAKAFMDMKKKDLGRFPLDGAFKPDGESWGCQNMPLVNRRQRFNRKYPFTKDEMNLLHDIRNKGKMSGNSNRFFGDLLSGR